MSRTVTVFFEDGHKYIYRGVPDAEAPDQVAERAQKDYPGVAITRIDGGRKPQQAASGPPVLEDVGKSVLPAAARGLTNLVGAPADLWSLLTSGLGKATGKAVGLVSPDLGKKVEELAKPENQFINKLTSQQLQQLAGIDDLYKPQTRVGKLAAGAVEGAASAPFSVPMAALGAVSGLAGEGAGQMAEGTVLETPARVAASIAAPVAIQGLRNNLTNAGKILSEATGDLKPEQFAEARRQMERAKALGISLSAPEVLPPSSVQQLMSDVAASKSGGQVVNAFMADRPQQVKSAVQRELLDRIGAANTPDRNMAVAKDTATQVIKNAERERTAATDSLFHAARADVVPEAVLDDIAKTAAANNPFLDRVNREAVNEFVRDMKAAAQVPEAPNNAAALGALYRTTRESLNPKTLISAPSDLRAARGTLGAINQDLKAALETASPNFAAGNKLYKNISDTVIDPLTAGPVGRVAGLHGFDASLPQNLNPVSVVADAKMARPESIRELYSQLNTVNPQAFPGIARTWLENAFDAATQRVQAGENRMIGANFAKAVYGTDQQIANFAETMRGVAVSNGAKNPDQFVKGAKNLMEVLQMTGKVPNIGSPTGGRLPTNEMTQGSNTAAIMETISAQPLNPTAKKLRQLASQRTYSQLAEILTSPDSIQKIEQLGKYGPRTTTAQALAVSILATSSDGQ